MSHLVRGLLALILLLQLSPAFGVGGAGVGNGRVPDALSQERKQPPRNPGDSAPESALPANSVLSLELSSARILPGESLRIRALVTATVPELITGCAGELRSPQLEFSTLLFDECQVTRAGKHLVELRLSYRFPEPTLPRTYFLSRLALLLPGGTEQELLLPHAELEIPSTKVAPNPLRAMETWIETPSGKPQVHLGESLLLRTLVETQVPLTAAGLEFQLHQGQGPELGSLQFKGRDVSRDSQSSWIVGYRETPYGKFKLIEFELRVPKNYESASRLDLTGILLLDEALQEARIPVTENGSISTIGTP